MDLIFGANIPAIFCCWLLIMRMVIIKWSQLSRLNWKDVRGFFLFYFLLWLSNLKLTATILNAPAEMFDIKRYPYQVAKQTCSWSLFIFHFSLFHFYFSFFTLLLYVVRTFATFTSIGICCPRLCCTRVRRPWSCTKYWSRAQKKLKSARLLRWKILWN